MELERPVRGGPGLAHGAHGGGPHHSPRVQMVPRAGLAFPTCSPCSELVPSLLCSHRDGLEGGTTEMGLTYRSLGRVDAHTGPWEGR